jgi:hypothetical protein
MGSRYVAQAGLEGQDCGLGWRVEAAALVRGPRPGVSCFSLPSAGNTGMYHHAQPINFLVLHPTFPEIRHRSLGGDQRAPTSSDHTAESPLHILRREPLAGPGPQRPRARRGQGRVLDTWLDSERRRIPGQAWSRASPPTDLIRPRPSGDIGAIT